MKLTDEQKTLNKTIAVASAGYSGDGEVLMYWDRRKARAVDTQSGDTLALFVAREISDACEGETNLQLSLECAERAISSAAYQLETLADHLAFMARKEAIRKEKEAAPSKRSRS